MVRGITFSDQIITSRDDAHCRNIFLNNAAGITKGCEMHNEESDIHIFEGYFVIYGRFVNVVGKETIHVPKLEAGSIYCRLVFEIDLNENNTTDMFNQGRFKVIKDLEDYPSVIHEDLDMGGKIYQLSFAKFKNTPNGITEFVSEIVHVNVHELWNDILSIHSSYAQHFDEYYMSSRLENDSKINQGFTNYYNTVTTMKNEVANIFRNYSQLADTYTEQLKQKIAEYESMGFVSETRFQDVSMGMNNVTTEFLENGTVVESSPLGRKEIIFNSTGEIQELMLYHDGRIVCKNIYILEDGTVKETVSELG